MSSPPSGAITLAPINLSVSVLRINFINPLVSCAAKALGTCVRSNFDTSKGMPLDSASISSIPAPAIWGSVNTTQGNDA